MSYGKDLSEQVENLIATLELEARYMRERNNRLESENEYLRKQVDVLLQIVSNSHNGGNH